MGRRDPARDPARVGVADGGRLGTGDKPCNCPLRPCGNRVIHSPRDSPYTGAWPVMRNCISSETSSTSSGSCAQRDLFTGRGLVGAGLTLTPPVEEEEPDWGGERQNRRSEVEPWVWVWFLSHSKPGKIPSTARGTGGGAKCLWQSQSGPLNMAILRRWTPCDPHGTQPRPSLAQLRSNAADNWTHTCWQWLGTKRGQHI